MKTVKFGVHGSVVFEMDADGGPLPRGVRPPTGNLGNLEATVWIICTEEEARTMAGWLSSRLDKNPQNKAAVKGIDLVLRQGQDR